MTTAPLPFLNLDDPGFSTRSDTVAAASARHWCARTPFGLAVLRHRQAGHILRDRRFRQGSHAWPDTVGLTGSFADFWRRSVISSEGAAHRLQRRVAQAALTSDYILSLEPDFTAIAADLLKGLPDEVEFVSAFSEPFAGRAITRLLGLDDDAATAVAQDASTLGLAMGIKAPQHQAAVNAATDRLMALAGRLLDRPEGPESFVSRLGRAASDLGLKNRQTLLDLVVISIFGGVDTTRAQLAFAVALFIDAPDHWTRLRKDPAGIPAAIEEVIRHRPTTTWSTREAIDDVTIDGVTIKAGEILHILVHATALDPETGAPPDFDPQARRKPHFGFGGGAHHCLGQFVARTDMACALRVLLQRVKRFEWAGTPVYLPDSGNTSPAALPVRLIRA